jgi:dihydrodipicolinate synthase/N-acetylneuraminate lyase
VDSAVRWGMCAAPIFAVVTPFGRDGSIDRAALADYLAFLEREGAQRIIAGGTTGEFASMTVAERKVLTEYCVAGFSGQVIAHVSACNAADASELLRHAADSGAHAALLLPPFYFREPSEAGVLRFFSQALGKATLPIYVYSFPRHTQFPLSPEFLAKIAQEFPFVRGAKDSGGWPGLAPAYKQSCPHLEIYVGADNAALEVLRAGLDGSVTGGANPVPAALIGLWNAWEQGRAEDAERMQALLNQWSAARKISGLEEIASIKASLAALLPGFPVYVRPPLTPATQPNHELAGIAMQSAQQAKELLSQNS